MAVETLIVGAGAVGAFYASRLAAATSPNRVSVICRSNYKAVKANGFSITSPTYGNYTFLPHRTFPNPEEARQANVRWNYIVVSTKALPDVSDDSELLEGLVGEDTAIVLIQNGLGVEEPYSKRFPKANILSAVTIASAAQPEHGKISHNRWTRISVGPYLPHTDTGGKSEDDEKAVEQNQKFIGLLKEGGVKDAEEYTHTKLQQVRWHKIAINASMNPSSVLSGGTANSEMAKDEEMYLHLKGMMDEVLETAPKVLGAPLSKDLASPERILESTKKNTSGSVPSMMMDWRDGKRMELEVILGNPIRIARGRGFEMPRLQSLYALLRKAQDNREKEKQGQNSKL